MSGPIIVPVGVAASGTGPTFRDYYLDLADELGFLHVTTVTATATNNEAARTVLLGEMGDDEWPEEVFGSYWVYVLDGAQMGQQRRIMARGYLGDEQAMLLNRGFAAPLVSGTSVAVTWPLPIARSLAVDGCKTFVNDGLNRIRVGARLALEGSGSTTTSLVAYPWLRDIAQTTGLYDRTDGTSSTDAAIQTWGRYDIEADGAGVNLVTDWPYADGTPFQLGVIAPADRLIYDGSAWGYATTPGLVNDTDQAVPPLEWVRNFGMVKALQFLELRFEQDMSLSDAKRERLLAQVFRRKPRYIAAAGRIALTRFPQAYAPLTQGMVSA